MFRRQGALWIPESSGVGSVSSGFGASGFNPLSLPANVAFLTASRVSGIASGQPLSAWIDQGPLGTHAGNGIAAQDPIYHSSGGANNLPYLDCGVGTNLTSLSFPNNVFNFMTEGECYYVFSNNDDPPSFGLGAKYYTALGACHVPYPADGKVYERWGTTAVKGAIFATGAEVLLPTVWNVVSAAGDFRVYENGVLKYTTAVNATKFDGTQLLFGDALTVSHFGKYYCYCMYSRVQTQANRDKMTAFLIANPTGVR